MESPFLYSLIKTLTLMNLISIAFFRWRYKLRSQGKELPWMKTFRKVTLTLTLTLSLTLTLTLPLTLDP